MLVLERTSQKRTVPSAEQLASSDSLMGLNAACSIPEECPRNSVEYLTSARSGFQIRSVRSAEPVAISEPVGFQARVRILARETSSENPQTPQNPHKPGAEPEPPYL